MEITQAVCCTRGGQEGSWGIIGEGPSRNMYKGHMDKAKWGRFEGRRWGWVEQSGCGGVKMETTVLEQQQQKKHK